MLRPLRVIQGRNDQAANENSSLAKNAKSAKEDRDFESFFLACLANPAKCFCLLKLNA